MTLVFYTRTGDGTTPGTGHWAGTGVGTIKSGPWLAQVGVGWSVFLVSFLYPLAGL